MIKKLPVPEDAQPLERLLGAGALAVCLALAGCSAPAVEGYQVQAPPEGFLYVVSQSPSRGVLLERSAVSQGVWFGDIKMDEPRSYLEVTRYRGTAREAEAAEARDARVAQVGPYTVIGPLRTRALPDSGTAWSWTEERLDGSGRLRSLQVSEVQSFDTVSFSLVFDTDVPERMTAAHLDAVLATFALGRTIIHWRAIWGVVGLMAVVATLLAFRSRNLAPTAYRLWDKEETPKSPPSSSPGESGHGESDDPS